MQDKKAEVEALFLDAGNTILGMDYGLLSRWASMSGLLLEPAILERAEPMARPALSQYLAEGASTEAGSTLEVYAKAILAAAADLTGELEAETDGALASNLYEAALPRLLEVLHDEQNWDQLWSCVPEGVPQALAEARDAGLKLVVVSNSDGGIDKKLERVQLLQFFDDIIDSGSVGVEKPDPRIFEIALERTGAKPERTVHCGDLEAVDIRGATAAGLRAVLLDPYGDWLDPGLGYPVPSCETARSVLELVQRLLAQR